jgi:CheY-like chemotaxis protein
VSLIHNSRPDTGDEKALNIIEGEDFEFVICDMLMPEMSGSDSYRIVKEKWPSLID